MTPSNKEYHKLSKALQRWFAKSARDLPWRCTSDPYCIWVSEIILQQTRVQQGYDYYLRFIEAFPTVEALAQAPEDQVLKMWQGLGYYSRARNLHKAAKLILEHHHGRLPQSYSQLIKLPGIGPYTAGAILSFAYHLPFPAVDGNVSRVLSRIVASEVPIDSSQGKKFYHQLAMEVMDRHNPAAHNQAIMELGALVCVPAAPLCEQCPINTFCASAFSSLARSLPIKAPKKALAIRLLHYVVVTCGDGVLLQKRGTGDIWAGLYEFPQVSSLLSDYVPKHPPVKQIQLSDKKKQKLAVSLGIDISSLSQFPSSLSLQKTYTHKLSHRQMEIAVYRLALPDVTAIPTGNGGYGLFPLCAELPAMPIVLVRALEDLKLQ